MLVELLEAACLLELAKIETTHVDSASYLQLAIDVIAQMYPVHGVAATVSVPGLASRSRFMRANRRRAITATRSSVKA